MPSLQDLLQGFDPTGLQSISAAQLLELVTSLSAYTDKGMVVTTTDVAGNPEVPDANTTTKWQRYIWRRISASSIGIYAWNPALANNATYLRWQSIVVAGIADGSIVNIMIADNTITDAKIANLDWSKILNKPAFMALSDNATGDLAGSLWSNATVKADAITTTKIADNNVTLAKLKATTLAAFQIIRVNAGVTAFEAVTKLILSLTEPGVGQALQLVRVNAAGTAFEYVSPANTGSNLLQVVSKINTASDSTGAIIPFDNTIPQVGEGKQYITQVFTPLSATSLLRVRFTGFVSSSVESVRVAVALFKSGSADALQTVAAGAVDGNPASLYPVVLDFVIASVSTAAITFSVRFGPESDTGYMNRSSAGNLFSTSSCSFLTIEEIIGTVS